MVNKIRKLLPCIIILFISFIIVLSSLTNSLAYGDTSVPTPSPPQLQVQQPPLFQTHPQFQVVAPTTAQPGAGTLSFYFQNIELRTLLQLIGQISGLNFVISDAIQGNVTLNLKNVTWQEALDIVLKTHGLMSRQIGNVMFINTIDEVSKMDVKEFQADQQVINLSPLSSAVIQLKYMTAKDLADILKGSNNTLLTTRGQVVVDPRTNSIIIRDIEANIVDIRKLVKKLDVPARQVLIEARIVTIDVNYEKELGVRFGVSNTRHLSGTWSGASQLTQGIGVANINPITQRLNFNNPAPPSQLTDANPGTIGLALARLGNLLLDLELSALEEEGHSEIIASPRVITSNQQKAVIQTGQQIPYQEATSSGATAIAFVNAVLSLEITPQITPDNKIVLALKATEDSAAPPPVTQQTVISGTGGTTSTSFGTPSINTHEVESNVLLNNNETIVLGGVYQKTKSKTVDRIPFFGSLPLLGALFRFTVERSDRSELLIFITPKIIESPPVLAAAKHVRTVKSIKSMEERAGEG